MYEERGKGGSEEKEEEEEESAFSDKGNIIRGGRERLTGVCEGEGGFRQHRWKKVTFLLGYGLLS